MKGIDQAIHILASKEFKGVSLSSKYWAILLLLDFLSLMRKYSSHSKDKVSLRGILLEAHGDKVHIRAGAVDYLEVIIKEGDIDGLVAGLYKIRTETKLEEVTVHYSKEEEILKQENIFPLETVLHSLNHHQYRSYYEALK